MKGFNHGVVAVNYDVLHTMIQDIIKWGPDYVALDESHLIKRAGSRRSRAAHKLGRVARYRRILTGTPDPKHLRDYYSQYKFLAPELLADTLADFDQQFCIMHPLWRDKVLRYQNLDVLKQRIFSVSSRVRRQDCFDIPKSLEIVRSIPMPPVVAKQYKELRSHLAGFNRLEQLLHLQQFTSGVNGGPQLKVEMVAEELEEFIENGQKAVVFCRFREEQANLVAHLTNAFPGVHVDDLHGDTSDAQRALAIRDFGPGSQRGEAAILVVQIATGRLGISLAGADVAVYTSLTFDAEHYDQAKMRIWDQTNPKTHIFLELAGTNDSFIRRTVQCKIDVSTRFLDEMGWQA